MKKCKECLMEKKESEFYGVQGECKDCTKKRVKKRLDKLNENTEWIEKERTRGREKYRRLYVGTGTSDIKRNRRYLIKYPEKEAAKNYSSKLEKPFELAEKHHWSYREEHFKDVIWLYKNQHMKAHRFLIYDQERLMYRRYDTNELLDTKQKHEAFILGCIKNKGD